MLGVIRLLVNMLYKLLNTLFGWDYVAWRNSADFGISRVYMGHIDYDGIYYKMPYYWRYKTTKVWDPIPLAGTALIWLTCSPAKYMDDVDKYELARKAGGRGSQDD